MSASGIARSASVLAVANLGWPGDASVCGQCSLPLGFQLTKLFGSLPARRSFTISLARWVPTSATRFCQDGVSASMAIWSSVRLPNSASEYVVLRWLLGSSQDGSVHFEASSSMSCPVLLPQSTSHAGADQCTGTHPFKYIILNAGLRVSTSAPS
jgi:hypothetical protein